MTANPLDLYTLEHRGRIWIAARKEHLGALEESGVLTASFAELKNRPGVEVKTGRGEVLMVPNPADKQKRFVVRFNRRGGLIGKILKHTYLAPQRRLTNELVFPDMARAAGLKAVENIAFAADFFFHPFARTRMISLEIPGGQDLKNVLENRKLDRREKRSLIQKTARSVRMMHDLGFVHADLHAKNMLLDTNKNVWILDWDSADFRNLVKAPLRCRNLARMLRYMRKVKAGSNFTQTDAYRFLIDYLGPDQGKFKKIFANMIQRFLFLHDTKWFFGARST